jgi:hypothetical protein
MSERFDDLTRAMAVPHGRRSVLKMFGAAAGGAVVASVLKPFRGSATVTCSGPSNIGSSPCAAGTTPCGPCCCQKGIACLDSTNGVCGCPSGTTPCGSACCQKGTACANPATSTCTTKAVACTQGQAACGTTCCLPGQTCSSGACVCIARGQPCDPNHFTACCNQCCECTGTSCFCCP